MTLPLRMAAIAAALVSAGIGARAQSADAPPLFALCMETHDARKRTLAEQAEMLRDLGYSGMGHLWLDGLAERVRTADQAGLEVVQVYMRMDLRPGKPPYDPRLKDVLPLLKGRKTQLAVLILGAKPSDETHDPAALRILGEIADLTESAGVRLVLYPHLNHWLERVEDGVRLARKMQPRKVGLMLNLCHWLPRDEERNLRPLLEQAKPFLAAVTINGADRAEEIRAKTGKSILPLDSGSYDVGGFLKALRESGYRGPVGLQCYGITGDARDHLARSMAVWRKFNAALNAR